MENVSGSWEAVAIVPGVGSCEISQRIQGHKFLQAAAPELPLSGCTAARCNCRYEHFADRRQGPRRAEDLGKFAMLVSGPETERRHREDRRHAEK